ncbi:MAG TPA: hypothetical protein VJU59_23270 [Paraburkholderia sp.]|uniref:hypothetical protein n=1 Tax=Paraburkholderia sp. TaxID=1926495 RepID=UPI002B489C98|nr:hypothetical protein [Paraburkholderia sp.]HKR42555.1 hypothetical protein [Paraburkholderia sp.]
MNGDAQAKASESPSALVAQGIANGANAVVGAGSGEPPVAPGMALVDSGIGPANNAGIAATRSAPPNAILSSGNGGNDDSASGNQTSNQGASSSAGGSPQTVTSPNAAMRANANASGTYVDPLTGQVVTADGTLAADHIVPKSWIKQQPGFDQLTPAQQSALLNDPANTQGLPTTFNSSKGAQMPGDWTTYKGQPLDVGYIQNSAAQAAMLRNHITNQINGMLGK